MKIHISTSIWTIITLQFVTSIVFSLALPFTQLEAVKFGLSNGDVAFIMGSNTVAFLAFSALFVILSRYITYHILIAAVFAICAFSFYLLATNNSVAEVLVSRALGGIHGAGTGILMAYITKKTQRESRAQIMGYVQGASTLGWIIGPAFLASGSQYIEVHWRNVFIVLAAGIFLISCIFLMLAKEKNAFSKIDNETADEALPKTKILRALFPLGGIIATVLVVNLLYFARNSIMIITAKENYVIELNEIGLFYFIEAVLVIIVEIFFIKRLEASRYLRMLAIVFLISAAGLSTAVFAGGPKIFFYLHLLILGIGVAMWFPILMARISDLVSTDNTASIMVFINLCVNAARLSGPLGLGVLLLTFPTLATFVADAVLLILAAITLLFVSRKNYL